MLWVLKRKENLLLILTYMCVFVNFYLWDPVVDFPKLVCDVPLCSSFIIQTPSGMFVLKRVYRVPLVEGLFYNV